MKYAVTFCAMDGDVGANLLWHSCILFSRMDEETKQLEVVDNWGFYGLPTTNKDSLSRQLKIKFGLDVDLKGNHGMLRHEEVRYLDRGRGLHGVTFELTQEQFEQLQNKCITMAADQENAIKEVVDTQGLQGKPADKTRIYAHEQYSQVIYELEKIKAQQKGQEPRLKPFELNMSWGLTGPSVQHSHNCKSQVISLLANVLTKKQIDRLTENGNHPTVPRYSGVMEPIFLHSSGPQKGYSKESGQIVYYRDGKNPEVKLHWTIPPQEFEALDEGASKLFTIDNEYCQEVRRVVKKLQELEWLFQNADIPRHLKPYKKLLINQIVACYKEFSLIEPKQPSVKISGVTGFFYSLFSLPKDLEEASLQGKIKRAKMLFNSLYMAIVDDWTLDEYPSGHLIEENNEQNNSLLETTAEALAAYLSVEEQKYLCRIIGRNYCTPDLQIDSSEERGNNISYSTASQ